jgi:hypothetical protein
LHQHFFASAFLCYCSTFPSDFTSYIVDKWKKEMLFLFKIVFNQDFAPNKFLAESIDIQTWRLNVLA